MLSAEKHFFAVLLGISIGTLNDNNAHESEHLSYDQIMRIPRCYSNGDLRIVEIDHEAS